MLFIFLLITTVSCQIPVEFSSRPTNVSIMMLYFTRDVVKSPVVLAPFGVWSLMAALSFGSTTETTREIFRGFLLLTDEKKFNTGYQNLTDTVFNVGNSGITTFSQNYLFADHSSLMERDYITFLEQEYNTIYRTMDFKDTAAASAIANTLITSFSPPVNNVFISKDFENATIIMSNIIFFKGEWSSPFNRRETILEPVYHTDGTQIGNINTMSRRMLVPYTYISKLQASVMELSLGFDNKYSMLIILPANEKTTKEVYRNLQQITLREIFTELENDVKKELDVKLPRFTFRSRLQLQQPLNDMGIYNAFEPDKARFTKVAREPIYIGTVEHNAVISVTESGVVAYGTTPGIYGVSNIQNDILPPLIFFLLEKPTATVLFAGMS